MSRDRMVILGIAVYALSWRYVSIDLFGLRLNPGVLPIAAALMMRAPSNESGYEGIAVLRVARVALAFSLLVVVQRLMDNSGQGWLQQLLHFVTAALILRGLSTSSSPARALAGGLTLAAVPSLTIGAWEILTGSHLSGIVQSEAISRGWQLAGSPYSLFGNPNDFANFCLVFIIVTLMWFARIRRLGDACSSAPQWPHFLLLAIAAWCVVESGSRIGVGMLPVLVALGIADRVLARRRAALTLGIGVLAGLVTYVISSNRYVYPGTDVSSLARRGLFETAGCFFSESPIVGIGASAFTERVLEGGACADTRGFVNPHNLVGEVSSEYGMLGIALLGGLILSISIRAFTGRRASLLAYLAAPIVGIVGAMASTYLDSPLLWLMLAGLSLSRWRESDGSRNFAYRHAVVVGQ